MLSDHCPLYYNLDFCLSHERIQNKNTNCEEKLLKNAPCNFVWTETQTTKFLNSLKSEENQNHLKSILNSDFNNPDNIVDSVTKLLIEVAERSKIKRNIVKKPHLKSNPPWFDENCAKLKKEIISLGKNIKQNPRNLERKKLLANLKKSLNQMIRNKKREFKNTILQKMKWNSKKSKFFWKLLDKLKNNPNKNRFITGISGVRWMKHFSNVLKNPNPLDRNELPPNTVENGPLDSDISLEEIKFASYILKHGKSPGIDTISNEMLSSLLEAKPEIIVKIFNSILKNPMIINSWHTSMISPIHKKSSKSNPDNYRGIALSSCFQKFFCAVLNQRLLDHVIKNNILSEAQLGFVPGNRTSDALFILHSLIDYYCKKNKKYIFGCFVDFSKAFDTIPREKLFQRLLDQNINGKFYDCLTTLYNKNKVCVKVGNKITETFHVNMGVKQGCILSPLLFNIYLSDLQANIECSKNDPVCFFPGNPAGCLIWADDLLLLSETEIGLNNMLNTLNQYAEGKGLNINIEKTKVMIFNKTGRHIRKNFYLGQIKIETCRDYKYLGFKITPHGGINPGLHDLKDRALRAYFKLKYQMGPSFRKHPLITIKLFETLIHPILLYASDFWGALKLPRNNPLETVFMKFCKELLGVQRQTTNIGVLLELGKLPLMHTAIKSAIKNWVRICCDVKGNKLVTSSYELNIFGNLAWATGIKNTLQQIGMFDIFLNRDRRAHLSFYQRKNDIFHQNSLYEIKQDSSKLRTYSLLKTQIGYESYLSQIQNINHRMALTKLRLSNHILKIETGRRQHLGKDLRFCPFCPNLIEDEKHFILQCKTYKFIRRKLFTWADTKLNNFYYLNDLDKFITLLTNINIMPQSASAVYKMFCIRNFLTKNHKNVE